MFCFGLSVPPLCWAHGREGFVGYREQSSDCIALCITDVYCEICKNSDPVYAFLSSFQIFMVLRTWLMLSRLRRTMESRCRIAEDKRMASRRTWLYATRDYMVSRLRAVNLVAVFATYAEHSLNLVGARLLNVASKLCRPSNTIRYCTFSASTASRFSCVRWPPLQCCRTSVWH